MEQYIDKAEVVAEIEKRIKTNKGCMLGLRNLDYYQGKIDALNDTISFINNLEVKDVNLEKEIELIKGDYEQADGAWNNDFDFIARHFFELGNKAQKGE